MALIWWLSFQFPLLGGVSSRALLAKQRLGITGVGITGITAAACAGIYNTKGISFTIMQLSLVAMLSSSSLSCAKLDASLDTIGQQ
jgi:hypothetical protein